MKFMDNVPQGVVAYTLNGRNVGDSWDKITVVYNGQPSPQTVKLPNGRWNVVVDAETAGTRTLREARGDLKLPPYSMAVLHQ